MLTKKGAVLYPTSTRLSAVFPACVAIEGQPMSDASDPDAPKENSEPPEQIEITADMVERGAEFIGKRLTDPEFVADLLAFALRASRRPSTL